MSKIQFTKLESIVKAAIDSYSLVNLYSNYEQPKDPQHNRESADEPYRLLSQVLNETQQDLKQIEDEKFQAWSVSPQEQELELLQPGELQTLWDLEAELKPLELGIDGDVQILFTNIDTSYTWYYGANNTTVPSRVAGQPFNLKDLFP